MKEIKLSSRWTHEEKEGLTRQADKLGHGDISGWAKGVSKPFGSPTRPKRPEVGEVKREFHPVRSLEACKLKRIEPLLHDPSIVCLPPEPFEDPRRDQSRAGIIASVNERLMTFCYKKIRKKAKPAPEPEKRDLLADCPTVKPEVIEHLKQVAGSMEREPEGYRYPTISRYAK